MSRRVDTSRLIELKSEGLSKQDIAQEMGLPVSTVEYYLKKEGKRTRSVLTHYEATTKESLEKLASRILSILDTRNLHEEKTKDLINILEILTRVRQSLINKAESESDKYEKTLKAIFDGALKERFPGSQRDDEVFIREAVVDTRREE